MAQRTTLKREHAKVETKGEEDAPASTQGAAKEPDAKKPAAAKEEPPRPAAERVRELFERVKGFSFDDPGAPAPATTFLARYTADFEVRGLTTAQRNVQEYLRFMCIKVVAEADGGGATPSVVVDAVWHTHLMHTRSYHRLCAELGQAYVHHEPSLGGPTATARYRAQYEATLRTYTEAFGAGHSYAVWPPVNVRFQHDLQYVMIQRGERDRLRAIEDQYEDDYGDPGCG